jgi:CubicO group peptidase (beta-lactamase class C family)
MKRFIFVMACSLISVSAQAGFWGSSLSKKAERAQAMLEGLDLTIAQVLKDYNVPGLAVGVVVDGHTVWLKGYGFRDLAKQKPVTPDTLFAVGSCTKAFTTFALGTLIEEGLLDWDTRVIDVLPDFRLWDQYATQNLTLRDLITHRSGIPRHDFMWYNSSFSREDLLKRLRYLEPTCNIRERYNYGNLTYLIAGLAMERMKGETWETLVSQKILTPLGMKKTNFSIAKMQESDDFAFPYLERNGSLKQIPFRDFHAVGPAAAMNSNASDMTHWIKMLLARGTYEDRPMISSGLIQEMFAAQVVISGYVENKEAQFNAYGLGWCINSYRGHYYVSHDGGPDGFTSVVSILPYDNIGVVVMANKNLINLPRYLSLEIVDRILELPSRNWLPQGLEEWKASRKAEEDARKSEEQMNKKGTMPSHPLSDYEGKYEHPGYGIVEVTQKGDKLEALFNGISCHLDHWHYDVFSIAEETQDVLISRNGMKFTFRTNLSGEIDQLLIPFEPKSPEIVFQKKMSDNFSDLSYYRQFLGTYEIYNIVFEFVIRDRTLVAVIPGQPLYELVPTNENEFNVKSRLDVSVRFMKDADGEVNQVQMISPYGAYTAHRKKI